MIRWRGLVPMFGLGNVIHGHVGTTATVFGGARVARKNNSTLQGQGGLCFLCFYKKNNKNCWSCDQSVLITSAILVMFCSWAATRCSWGRLLHNRNILNVILDKVTTPKYIPIKKLPSSCQMNLVPMYFQCDKGVLSILKTFRNVKSASSRV